jgi:hypothetical protein
VTEQLRFEEVLGEGGAVLRDEHLVAAAGLVVDRGGDQLLARTGLALDADGGARIDHALELAQQRLHRRRVADDVVELDLLLLALEVDVLATGVLGREAEPLEHRGVVDGERRLPGEQQRDLEIVLGEHPDRRAVVALDQADDVVAAPQRDREDRQDRTAEDRLGGQRLERVRGEHGGAIGEHATEHGARGPDRIADGLWGIRIGAGALPRHGEREPILVLIAAEQDRDVGGAREELERGGDRGLDDLGGLEAGAERLQGLVDPECADRVVLELICQLRQIHDRARRDQPITQVVLTLVADPDGDPHGIGRVAEQDEIAIGEGDLPSRRGVDGDPAAIALDGGSVGRAQIAEHEVLADLRDLRVVAGQMEVGDDDRARRGTPEGGRTTACEYAMRSLRGGAAEDF